MDEFIPGQPSPPNLMLQKIFYSDLPPDIHIFKNKTLLVSRLSFFKIIYKNRVSYWKKELAQTKYSTQITARYPYFHKQNFACEHFFIVFFRLFMKINFIIGKKTLTKQNILFDLPPDNHIFRNKICLWTVFHSFSDYYENRVS